MGMETPPVKRALAAQDKALGRLVAGLDARGAFAHTTLLVVSDHGMAPVDRRVDLAAALRAGGEGRGDRRGRDGDGPGREGEEFVDARPVARGLGLQAWPREGPASCTRATRFGDVIVLAPIGVAIQSAGARRCTARTAIGPRRSRSERCCSPWDAARSRAPSGELRSLDVAPTMLSLLGLEVPDTMEGRPIASLVPAVAAHGIGGEAQEAALRRRVLARIGRDRSLSSRRRTGSPRRRRSAPAGSRYLDLVRADSRPLGDRAQRRLLLVEGRQAPHRDGDRRAPDHDHRQRKHLLRLRRGRAGRHRGGPRPKAIAADARGERPFGREFESPGRAGRRAVRDEEVMGRDCEIYRLTDAVGPPRAVGDQGQAPAAGRVDRLPARHRANDDPPRTSSTGSRGSRSTTASSRPDPSMRFERLDFADLRRRSSTGEPVGPVPVLYTDLLAGVRRGSASGRIRDPGDVRVGERGVVSASTASLRAILPAISRNTRAASESGASTRIGRPWSPPSTMRGSIGTSPRKGRRARPRRARRRPAEDAVLAVGQIGRREVRHVLDDAEHGDLHLLEHLESLARVDQREVVRGGDDHARPRAEPLGEREGRVAGPRRHVDHQIVELAPLHVRLQAFEFALRTPMYVWLFQLASGP